MSHILVGAAAFFLGRQLPPSADNKGSSASGGPAFGHETSTAPSPSFASGDVDPRMNPPTTPRHAPTPEQVEKSKKRIERWNKLPRESQALFHRAISLARVDTAADFRQLRAAIGEGRVSQLAYSRVGNPQALYAHFTEEEITEVESVRGKLKGIIRAEVAEHISQGP